MKSNPWKRKSQVVGMEEGERKTLKIKGQTIIAEKNFTSKKTFKLQVVLTMEDASREWKIRKRAI